MSDQQHFDAAAEGWQVIAEERVPSNVANIGPAVERVVAYLRMDPRARVREGEVSVALREAVANAVIHGNRMDPNKLVQIMLASATDGSLLLIVRDSGRGFDPSGVRSPVQGRAVHAPNGRGVFLMRELMKDVTFRDGGREVRIRIA